MDFGTFALQAVGWIFGIMIVIMLLVYGFPIIIGGFLGGWLWQFGMFGHIIGGSIFVISAILELFWLSHLYSLGFFSDRVIMVGSKSDLWK